MLPYPAYPATKLTNVGALEEEVVVLVCNAVVSMAQANTAQARMAVVSTAQEHMALHKAYDHARMVVAVNGQVEPVLSRAGDTSEGDWGDDLADDLVVVEAYVVVALVPSLVGHPGHPN